MGRGLIVIGLVIVLLSSVVAQNIGDIEKGLDNRVEKVENFQETLTDKEVRNEYLKKEWSKLFEKSAFGRFLLGVSDIFNKMDPIFNFFIGVEYSLSWLFFLSLVIWLVIIALVYKPVKEIFRFEMGMSFLIGISVASLAAQLGAVEFGLNIFLIPIFENPWLIVLAFVIITALVFVYYYYLVLFGKFIKEERKKAAEERRELKKKVKEKMTDDELKAKGAGI